MQQETLLTQYYAYIMPKELDRTHRIGNPKSGNKRPRPIIVKFARHSTRRKVFVNKKRSKNTEISITKSLTKQSKKRIWI